MNLLALETSSPHGSIAINKGNNFKQLYFSAQKQQISEILPLINSLLIEADLKLEDLDMLCFSAGPGSFTGIRVALGIIQGLALAKDIPVASVSSLQVLAQTAYRLYDFRDVVCINNAFMQELYIGCYKLNNNGIMKPVLSEQLIKPDLLSVPEGQWNGVGDAWPLYAQRIEDCPNITFVKEAVYPQAQDIFMLAETPSKIDNITANYLRQKEAWQATR